MYFKGNMEWLIIVLVVIGIVWFMQKSGSKQFNLSYNYLTMLLLACKSKEEFDKLLWRLYSYDSEVVGMHEFNAKWEALCNAAKVQVIKDGFYVSPDVLELIADNIYNDPQNQRYIKQINSLYPDSMPLEKLKEKMSELSNKLKSGTNE